MKYFIFGIPGRETKTAIVIEQDVDGKQTHEFWIPKWAIVGAINGEKKYFLKPDFIATLTIEANDQKNVHRHKCNVLLRQINKMPDEWEDVFKSVGEAITGL